MTEQEDTKRKPRRDLLLVLLILPFGILCMFMTGQVAIKLAPSWVLNADMRSLLDPNATFVAQGIPPLLEPINPAILTRPAWGNLFLTPQAVIPTRLIPAATPPPVHTPPPPPVQNTPEVKPEPTSTIAGPIVLPTHSGPLQTDLKVEISDNSRTYTPGTAINYTILVTNLGPDYIPRFNITDEIPDVIAGIKVNCTPANLCGTNTSSGNTISYTGATLLYNEVITISISGTVASSATGDLVNTATVLIPSGVRAEDPNSSNNTATDRDTQLSVYDLAITKNDGVDTYAVATPLQYTVVVTNSGPSDATDVSVRDNIPIQIASWTWTCTNVINASRCTGDTSSSNFRDTVDIRSGGRIEYSVSAIPATAPVAQNPLNLNNTVTVVFPNDPRFTDPNLNNNTATDTDMPYIDLQITKDDSVVSYAPGDILNYLVTVTNNSTFNLIGVSVTDNMPIPTISSWNWTCAPAPGSPGASCTIPSGTGNISNSVNLPVGTSVYFSINATVSNTAIGDLNNTATVNAPVGLIDAVPENNSAIDVDVFGIGVDLQIAKDDGVATYSPGGTLQYIVTVTNNGPSDVTGASVIDSLPPLISSWSWTCAPTPGSPSASCTTPSGVNSINTTVNLPAGQSVDFTIDATVSNTATGDLVNTASVVPPAGFVDTDASNDTVADTDTLNIADPTPPQIGTTFDNNYYALRAGDTLTLSITTVVNGNLGPDLVYYEFLNNGTVNLDWIQVWVGDGTNWYKVFDWGDQVADLNSNMNFNNWLPAIDPPEPDQRPIPSSAFALFPPSGITIDLDGYAPPGIYPYVRFYAPLNDVDGQLEIDAVRALP